jgi:hypothetical protein
MHIKLNINKEDTQIFKGIAIIIISLHNIIHKLPDMPIENEFSFHESNIKDFFTPLFFKSPISFIFSFLGHYGVQVFVFLSAYAFYLKRNEILNMKYFSFIKKRYIRILYPFILSLIIVSILEFIYITFFLGYPFEKILHNIIVIYAGGIAHFTVIQPFLWGILPGGVGPWWFVSFILQVYFIFPFLFKIEFNNAYQFVISLGFSYLLIFVINIYFPNIHIYYTIIGHMPEILLAIYFVKYLRGKQVSLNKMIYIIWGSLIMLFICNANKNIWPFSFAFATVFIISLLLIFRSIMTESLKNIFIFIGKVSIYVFLLNGVTREYFIYFINSYSDSIITYWLIIILYLLLTIYLSYLLQNLEKYVREIIKNNNVFVYLKKSF